MYPPVYLEGFMSYRTRTEAYEIARSIVAAEQNGRDSDAVKAERQEGMAMFQEEDGRMFMAHATSEVGTTEIVDRDAELLKCEDL